jgi:hypothetical protein
MRLGAPGPCQFVLHEGRPDTGAVAPGRHWAYDEEGKPVW